MKRKMFTALIAVTLSLMFSMSVPARKNPGRMKRGTNTGGVTIYYKADFDDAMQGFRGSKKLEMSLTQDAISGKALKAVCKEKWAGPALNFDIKGSEDLKMAFMAKGQNFQVAGLNVFDQKARDNTTPYAYRFLPDNIWTPVLYYLDRFRYNSKMGGYVNQDTAYTGVRFYGPKPQGKEVSITLDNFVIYRGVDRQPPEKIAALKAKSTKKGVLLTWSVAKDNVSSMVYVISRANEGNKFVKIGESYLPKFLDNTVGEETYYYRILACDFENNVGPWSDTVKVVSISDIGKRALSREKEDRLNYAQHVREVHNRGKDKVRKGHVLLYGDSLTGAALYHYYTIAALGIYTVNARGFGGMTTGWGRGNVLIKALEPENPEFMLVLFGTNNVRGKMRKQVVFNKWINDMEAIVKEGESKGTIVVLGTIPPRHFKDPESRPEASFNKSLIQRARELKIPIAYLFRDIQAAGDRKNFISGDGVHWTAKGMEVAGKAWAKALRQVEFAIRDRPDS